MLKSVLRYSLQSLTMPSDIFLLHIIFPRSMNILMLLPI